MPQRMGSWRTTPQAKGLISAFQVRITRVHVPLSIVFFFFIHGLGSVASLVAGHAFFVWILGLMLAMPYRQILGTIIGSLLSCPFNMPRVCSGAARKLGSLFLSVL